MIILPPLINHWQCVVKMTNRTDSDVIYRESSSQYIAYQQTKSLCEHSIKFCDPKRIFCYFNAAQTPTQTCEVRDDQGHRWTVRADYQACQRALQECQQTQQLNIVVNNRCYIVK